jgi:thiol:disulfide interchange protein DsbD
MLCDEAQCVFPMPVPFSFNINSNGSIQEAEEQEIVTNQDIENTEKYNDKSVDLDNPSADCGEKKSEENSLWAIFLLGLLGGLIALITPCVFPMIPLTVSFFTKGEKGKGMFNAIMYGFFIMLIYFLLSIPFHIMPNIDPEILNQISTNSWLNLFFFAIFIAFALSFFGYFELALPSKWGNKADSGSNIGGLIGIFFMALTLAIVSFSWTGPILGSLLAGTLGGDVSTVVILGMEFKMVAKSEPRIGPVQEKETIAKVKAMKKIPINPPILEPESALLPHLLGNANSKYPKKERAKAMKMAKKNKLSQLFVEI